MKFTSLFSSIGHGIDSLDGFFLLSRVDPYLIPHFSCFFMFLCFLKGLFKGSFSFHSHTVDGSEIRLTS